MADEPNKPAAKAIKDDAFYQVRLSKSTTLNGDVLAAANAVRLSGASLKQVLDDVYSAEEIAEDAKHDIMRDRCEGPVSTN